MDDITLYFCNPNKNKDCPKTLCFESDGVCKVCKSTDNPEYAVVDARGLPMISYKVTNGEVVINND